MGLLAALSIVPTAGADERPKTIELVEGSRPEGIATQGNTFYVSSIPTGAVYMGDLRTGSVTPFVPAQEGRSSIGLSLGDGMLFVAGGGSGQAYVYDVDTGAEIAVFQLTTNDSFINDVVATSDAAYFTDSANPVIYKVPIEGPGVVGSPTILNITGDLVYSEGFNANGIDATPNGDTLVVVQSNEGELFTVDPDSGASEQIDLGGATVENGDGILLEPNGTLWVLRNQNNLLVEIDLAPDLSSGSVVGEFTDETFDIPTTLADAGSRFAIVNARFGTTAPETPDEADYWVTQLRRPN